MPPQTIDVAVDARCLQDDRFRTRGIGQFVSAILAGRAAGPGTMRLIGLIDGRLPALSPQHAALFDAVRPAGGLAARPAALICPSPMTHPTVPFSGLLRGPQLCVAIAHDFIPLDHPEIYLKTLEAKLEYAARLVWLRDFDRIYTNSQATRTRLHALNGMPLDDMVVTGIPLRADLMTPAPAAAPAPATKPSPYILVSGGNDWRKNVEVALTAHARSATLARSRVRLIVFGGYPQARQAELARTHAAAGGDPTLLTFSDHLSDARLAALYAGAVASVTPSRNEGFSMPIVEAAAFGCPALAARCPAHQELLPEADLFEPDDVVHLQYLMEQLFAQPDERSQARARQAGLPARFSATLVCTRFWRDFGQRLLAHDSSTQATPSRPAILRGARPSLGFVSPMPPDWSGVADYSASTLRELGRIADVHVYTETIEPRTAGLPLASIGPLSPVAYSGRHDAMVSVLGNSHLHLATFNEFMEWGGASIAHDARMLNFYYELFGEEHAKLVAAAELGRTVQADELRQWLANPNQLPAYFLDEIARVSTPMFVHSPTTVSLLAERGLPATLLPFSPYRVLPDGELTPEARTAARKRLNQPDGRILVVSFGAVLNDRAIMDSLWAVEMLRSWGFDAALVCVGAAAPAYEHYYRNMASAVGMADYFMMTPRGTSEQVYRLWLAAADFGIQLRTYKLGGLSGALLDCIAAGLPTVANEHLAAAMLSPDWVARVPDNLSAVLIAEAIAERIEAGVHRRRPLKARAAMLEQRGFPAYCRRLLEGLGFEAPEPSALRSDGP